MKRPLDTRAACGLVRRECGISVAELLTVLTILGMVVTFAYLAFNSASGISDATQAQSQAREAGMRVLDMMALEIRQAREAHHGNGAFAIWGPRDCAFFADVTRDGHPEKIRYYVSNGKLFRTVAPPANSAEPYVFGAEGPPHVVLDGIKPSWTGNVFTYYAQAHPSVLATTPVAISAVGLNLVNDATIGTRTASVELSTTVKVRSVHNELDLEQ